MQHIKNQSLETTSSTIKKRTPAVLHRPQLVHGGLDQVLVVADHEHAAAEQRQALESKGWQACYVNAQVTGPQMQICKLPWLTKFDQACDHATNHIRSNSAHLHQRLHRVHVQVVGRLVQQQQVRLGEGHARLRSSSGRWSRQN